MDQSNKKSILFSLLVFFALLAILPIIVYQVQKPQPQETRTRAFVKEDAVLIDSLDL